MPHQLKFLILACSFLTFCSCETLHQNEKVRRQQRINAEVPSRENFGNDWQFRRSQPSQDTTWQNIQIPHSVKIEPLVVNDQWQGRAFYKKSFFVEKIGDLKWFFHFEGVMQEARVSVNDSLISIHKGGYLPFTVDATPFLKNNSKNTIEVEVINLDDPEIPPGKPLKNLDFNYYGGIYRNVFLIKKNPVYITNAVHANEINSGGLLLHFDEVGTERADGILKTHVKNDGSKEVSFQVRAVLTSQKGENISFLTPVQKVSAGADIDVVHAVGIKDPELWSPSEPNLYNLKVEIFSGKEILDSEEITVGVRNIKLTNEGFFLNGKKIFLNGTNRHQEYPYVGYAISDEANYRDAYKIKEAGFNFVRLSHYPQTPAFYRACDELGLLVMNCIPGWQFFGNELFQERVLQDIRDMARRDRNHPSVIFWENSLNESGMSPEFIMKANQTLKEELPYNDTYSAGWIDHPAYDLFTPARQHSKPPDYWNKYNKPNRPILVAEYGDWEYYAQNAGFNQKAFRDLKEEDRTSRQLRGAGEKQLLQQALNFQEAANSNLKGAQTIGMANWLMFDYNRGYSDDLEASGIADIFRIPKFSYYFYKSQKSPFGEFFSEPMVFIASYWNKKSSEEITVYSNTEEVALYLNGDLIEKKKPKKDEFSNTLAHPPFKFSVPSFESGELKAVGFINGKEVAFDVVNTAGEPSAIALSVDISGREIAKDHLDVVFVYAKIVDENGNVVPSDSSEVFFEIQENNASTELIGQNPVKAEAGIATILLRTTGLSRPLIIKAMATNLKEGKLKLE